MTSNMEEIELPVFEEGPPPTVTRQPVPTHGSGGGRRRLSVSTIMTSDCFYAGLDFLNDENQLIIQQTIEPFQLRSSIVSESRYIIKVPRGETIFYGTESSESCQRTCFGSSRAFNIKLFDKYQNEAMDFRRRLACGNCTFWCYLQVLEIWTRGTDFVGTVEQEWSLSKTKFKVYNKHRDVIFCIEGPYSFGILFGKAQSFKIYTSDGDTQIGSIIHQWDAVSCTYNLLIQMPGHSDAREKAILLGAAFLLEFMYFQSATSNSCVRPCCCC